MASGWAPGEGSEPRGTAPKVVSIQYLRWLAATLVVFHHVLDHFPATETARSYAMVFGEAGVDIFFVISGFIMWHISARGRMTPGAFLLNRVTRIVPLYWLFTLAMVVMAAVMPSAFRFAVLDPSLIVRSLLFIPTIHPKLQGVAPFLPVGWTLQVEMFFYVLFALFILLPARTKLAATTLILAGLAALGFMLPRGNPFVDVYTGQLLLEFAAGMVIGYLHQRGMLMPAGAGLVIAAVALVAMYPLTPLADDFRAFAWGIPSALVVFGALSAEAGARRRWICRPLVFLGDASYSLYLSHLFALGAVRLAWRYVPPYGTTAAVAYVVCGLVVATGVGGLTHVLVEKPLIRASRALVLRLRAPRPLSAAASSGA